MIELYEVSGAIERPAACRIRVAEGEDGTLIDIPARGASIVMWLSTIAFIVVLSTWIVMTVTLLMTGRPIFIIAWIADHGITTQMHRYLWFLSPFFAASFAFGIAGVFWILRPCLSRELLVFGPNSLRHTHTFLHRHSVREFPYQIMRSFNVSTDPEGFTHGTLTLICRGEDHEIGEFLSDSDREWLASVGNSILRRHPL